MVKQLTVREFRNNLAAALEHDGPVLITRHGRNVAIVYPLGNPASAPLEVRQMVIESMSAALATPLRWPTSAVIEQYKRDIDRTLIQENLRRTPAERLAALQALQEFARELRRAR